jgi:hypothetical protein
MVESFLDMVPCSFKSKYPRHVNEEFVSFNAEALALSHARSGRSIILSGYMGKNDGFDKAIAAFSMAYADQSEKDHAVLKRAIHEGKVKAVFEKAN